jgi:hypothetical protein
MTMRLLQPCLVSGLAAAALSVAALAGAQESTTMALNCAGTQSPGAMQANEAWIQSQIRAFTPKPGAPPSLRIDYYDISVQQVLAAKDGIVQVCRSYLNGATPKDVADRTLAGFEQTIREFVESLGNQLTVLAAGGQVNRMPAIRQALATVLAVSRQEALMGDSVAAMRGVTVMMTALTNFSGDFTESCYGQEFDPGIAIEVERQNEIAGTGIDVTPCARRRFYAHTGMYTFKSCSVSGVGEWKISQGLAMLGSGTTTSNFERKPDGTASGTFSIDLTVNGVTYTSTGDATLRVREQRDARGELLSRDYKLYGSIDFRLTKGGEKLAKISELTGGPRGGDGKFELDPEVSDKPCKSADDED